MKRPKPQGYEDEPNDTWVGGVGSYQRIGGIGKSKMKQAIGFIRPKAVKVQMPKRKK